MQVGEKAAGVGVASDFPIDFARETLAENAGTHNQMIRAHCNILIES